MMRVEAQQVAIRYLKTTDAAPLFENYLAMSKHAASSIAKPTKMLIKPLKLSKDGVLNMIKSLPIY